MEKKIFGILPMAAILDKRVTLNDLRVFAALSSFQGRKADCFPSLKKISERSGIHPSHVPKHTRRLAEFGYIRKTRRGKRISNVYVVLDDYAHSAISPPSEYAKAAESEHAKAAESEYATPAQSNIKTPNISTLKTSSEGGEQEKILFKNEFFSVNETMLHEWRQSYPRIAKFHPELNRVSDVLREKKGRGEQIGSPMAFLHTHLTRVNEEHGQRDPQKSTGDRTPRGGGPISIGDILKKATGQ